MPTRPRPGSTTCPRRRSCASCGISTTSARPPGVCATRTPASCPRPPSASTRPMTRTPATAPRASRGRRCGLAPGEHLLDAGDPSAANLAASAARGITLVAPVAVLTGRNARQGTFGPSAFTVDWRAGTARCPAGQTSRSMRRDKRGLVTFAFSRHHCRPSGPRTPTSGAPPTTSGPGSKAPSPRPSAARTCATPATAAYPKPTCRTFSSAWPSTSAASAPTSTPSPNPRAALPASTNCVPLTASQRPDHDPDFANRVSQNWSFAVLLGLLTQSAEETVQGVTWRGAGGCPQTARAGPRRPASRACTHQLRHTFCHEWLRRTCCAWPAGGRAICPAATALVPPTPAPALPAAACHRWTGCRHRADRVGSPKGVGNCRLKRHVPALVPLHLERATTQGCAGRGYSLLVLGLVVGVEHLPRRLHERIHHPEQASTARGFGPSRQHPGHHHQAGHRQTLVAHCPHLGDALAEQGLRTQKIPELLVHGGQVEQLHGHHPLVAKLPAERQAVFVQCSGSGVVASLAGPGGEQMQRGRHRLRLLQPTGNGKGLLRTRAHGLMVTLAECHSGQPNEGVGFPSAILRFARHLQSLLVERA